MSPSAYRERAARLWVSRAKSGLTRYPSGPGFEPGYRHPFAFKKRICINLAFFQEEAFIQFMFRVLAAQCAASVLALLPFTQGVPSARDYNTTAHVLDVSAETRHSISAVEGAFLGASGLSSATDLLEPASCTCFQTWRT